MLSLFNEDEGTNFGGVVLGDKRNVDEIRLFGFLGSSAGFRWESNDWLSEVITDSRLGFGSCWTFDTTDE